MRYAPTPRFILLGWLSALKASEMPRMASGGACGVERGSAKAHLVVAAAGRADWRQAAAAANCHQARAETRPAHFLIPARTRAAANQRRKRRREAGWVTKGISCAAALAPLPLLGCHRRAHLRHFLEHACHDAPSRLKGDGAGPTNSGRGGLQVPSDACKPRGGSAHFWLAGPEETGLRSATSWQWRPQ